MKRSKRIAILSGVLAAACVATFILSRYEGKKEEIRSTGQVILEVDARSVDSLAWEYSEDDVAFSFTKTEDGWSYDEDPAFPVSTEAMEQILSGYEALSAAFIIENVEDYGQYGLEDPECTVSIAAGESSYEIKLGSLSAMDQQRYVDIGDGNVYLVSNDPADELSTELSAMIQHDDTPIFEEVTSVEFTGEHSYTIKLDTGDTHDYTYAQEDVYYTMLDGVVQPMDTINVDGYLNTLSSLTLVDYVTYDATDDDLADCGMDEPELSATISYSYIDDNGDTAEDVCVFHIGSSPEELEAYEQAVANEDEELPSVTRYIRMGDSSIIYRLDEVDYMVLHGGGYDDLRHQELFWADFDLVTQMDVTLDGESHTFTSALEDEDDEDSLRHWYYDGEEVDVYPIQSALESIKADSFTSDASSGRQELAITLYLSDENFPTVTIKLYRHDGSLCLAMVDGKAVSLVDRPDAMELVEAIRAIVLG